MTVQDYLVKDRYQVLSRAAYFLVPACLILFLVNIGFNLHLHLQQSLAEAIQADSQRISTKINERLNAYSELLKAGAALFAASNSVERSEWKSFVEKLDLDQNYRGIQGLGFSKLIPKTELADNIARIRQEGFPDFVVTPPGDRPIYTSIIYLEPFSGRNLRAFGYDMFSETTRNEALCRARDIGDVAFTGKVRLLQETKNDVQAGILAYYPVFKNGVITQSLEQRQAAVIGWVYSPYRMNDLIEPIVDGELSELHLQIFDGEKTAENLLFDSAPELANFVPDEDLLQVEHDVKLEAAGRVWTMHFSSLPGYAAINRVAIPWPEYLGLTSIGVLTLAIVGISAKTRSRAYKIARTLTDDLREQTERLKANQLLLQESESRFQAVSNAAPALIWLAGTDKHCYWFNQVWLDFTGRSMEQEMGSGWAEGVHPDDFARCLDIYTSHFDQHQPFKMEYRLRRHDGVYRWIHDNGIPRFDGQGHFLGYIGSCIDITDNINALELARENERQLHELNQQNRALFMDSPDAYFIMELEGGKIADCNLAAEKLLRGSRESIIGLTPDRLSPDLQSDGRPSLEAVAERIQQTMDKGYNRFEWMHRRLDGKEFWADITISVIAFQQRKALLVAWRDISEQKSLELTLQEQQISLRDANQKLQLMNSMVEDSADPFYVVDPDDGYRMVFVNQASCEHYGWCKEKLLTMRVPDWDADVDAGKLQELLTIVRTQGHMTLLTRHRVACGEIVPVEVSVNYLKDESGEYLFGYITDLRQRLALEKSLNDAKEAAERMARSKSEFLANMSHEIRTPMNGIIGLSKLALDKQLPLEVRDYLEKIHNSSENLLEILNDILDFSKLEAGKFRVEHQRYHLEEVLENLHILFSHRAAEKSLAFEIDIAENTCTDLIGDALRLSQVLANLVGNAIKFTERGQVRIQIKPAQQEGSSARLEFSVSDTGIGIAAEDMQKLFQPFSQLDTSASRNFGGTGLGLAITKQLLELMGSELSVESVLGQGSTFRFVLPVALASNQLHHIIVRHAEGRLPGALSKGLRQKGRALAGARILVVEDNKINQQVVKEFLRLSSVQVRIANNGQEALDCLAREDVDAILMDVHMPGMGGIAATEIIRAQARYVGLPIIALTAGVTEDEHRNCLRAGMNDFLPKPVNPEQMLAVLGRWVQKPNLPDTVADSPADLHHAVDESPRQAAGEEGASCLQPSQTRLWPNINGIDADYAQFLLAGDLELFIELLAVFATDNAELLESLKKHAAKQEWPVAAQMIHKLKGQIANLGARELAARAVALEAAVKTNSPDIAEFYASLVEGNDQLLAAIKHWLKTNDQS